MQARPPPAGRRRREWRRPCRPLPLPRALVVLARRQCTLRACYGMLDAGMVAQLPRNVGCRDRSATAAATAARQVERRPAPHTCGFRHQHLTPKQAAHQSCKSASGTLALLQRGGVTRIPAAPRHMPPAPPGNRLGDAPRPGDGDEGVRLLRPSTTAGVSMARALFRGRQHVGGSLGCEGCGGRRR